MKQDEHSADHQGGQGRFRNIGQKRGQEEQGYDDNEAGVFTANNSNIGFFTWKKNASIDGVSKEIVTSEIETDEFEPGEQKLYMNYPNGTLIYHDPKIGIQGLSTTSTPPPDVPPSIPGFELFSLLAVSTVGIILISYIVHKKKAKHNLPAT